MPNCGIPLQEGICPRQHQPPSEELCKRCFASNAKHQKKQNIPQPKQLQPPIPRNILSNSLQQTTISTDLKFKICLKCFHSTTQVLDEHDLKAYNRLKAKTISWIGNKLQELGMESFKYRCKLCGCSCYLKGKFGAVFERMLVDTGCPEKWPDGKNNWEHGTPLNRKE